MSSQFNETRVYSSANENTDTRKIQCPQCKVQSVPRGISTSGTNALGDVKTNCPNCGHVYGGLHNSLLNRHVDAVQITSAGSATTITVDNGTLQLTATISPIHADNKGVTWTSSNVAIATVSQTGLVTAITNGPVIISASSKENSAKGHSFALTMSNQV